MRFVIAIICGFASGLWAIVEETELDRTEQIYSNYENLLIRRADVHYHAGEFAQSANIFQILHGMHPDDTNLARNWAWMLGNAEEFDEAFSVMISYRLMHPSDVWAALGEAELFVQKAREEDRVPRIGPSETGSPLWWRVPPLLEPHLEKRDIPLTAFTFLSASYEKVGLLREALRVWEIRKARFPDDPACTPNISRLQNLLGKRG